MKIIIANYKMNPLTLSASIKLAKAEDFSGVFIAPPSLFLAGVKENIQRAGLAAQDVSNSELTTGAWTGEISATMLKKIGVKLVLIGHSERRVSGETEAQIAGKVKTALAAGLKVVLCVGEPLIIRQKGMSAVKEFLKKQIVSAFSLSKNHQLPTKNLLIAYEPIWAIGSGQPATPEVASEVSVFLRSLISKNYNLSTKILYGGSVSAANAKSFLNHSAIDGLLIGGLSLKPKEFKKCV